MVLLIPGAVELGNGVVSATDCGLGLQPGSRWILAAPRGPDGTYLPSVCLPHAVLGTEEGTALLAEAERPFGPGTVPAAPPLASPPAEPKSAPDDRLPLVLATLVGALAAASIAGAVAVGLRRRHGVLLAAALALRRRLEAVETGSAGSRAADGCLREVARSRPPPRRGSRPS